MYLASRIGELIEEESSEMSAIDPVAMLEEIERASTLAHPIEYETFPKEVDYGERSYVFRQERNGIKRYICQSTRSCPAYFNLVKREGVAAKLKIGKNEHTCPSDAFRPTNMFDFDAIMREVAVRRAKPTTSSTEAYSKFSRNTCTSKAWKTILIKLQKR